jgi:hypothetical protein
MRWTQDLLGCVTMIMASSCVASDVPEPLPTEGVINPKVLGVTMIPRGLAVGDDPLYWTQYENAPWAGTI